jgi:hypothetical protein
MKRTGKLAALLAISWCFVGQSFAQWNGYAQDPQHTALAGTASQSLRRIHWQAPVDLQPGDSDGELQIHYGSPLVTAANTVIVPVKTAATSDIRAAAPTGSVPAILPITKGLPKGFHVEARTGSSGSLIWRQATDYMSPAHQWTPVFGPVLTSAPRLYFPGAGGTVYYRDSLLTVKPNKSRNISSSVPALSRCATCSYIAQLIRPWKCLASRWYRSEAKQ